MRSVGASLDATRLEEAFAELRRGGYSGTDTLVANDSAHEAAVRDWREGRIRLDAADPRGALPWFDSALRHDPRYAQAYDDRGIARFRLGEYRTAYADFADSLMWDILDSNGKWDDLIVGHDARAQWTPPSGAIAAFVKRLMSL